MQSADGLDAATTAPSPAHTGTAALADPDLAPAASRSSAQGRLIGASVIAAILLALVVVGLPVLRSGPSDTLSANPVGQQAPDFTLPLLENNESIGLARTRGYPVVLNFWASWCAPCQQEAAALAAAEVRWRAAGVIFVGVNARDTKDSARDFVRRNVIGYHNGVDATGAVSLRYGVTGFPETFFIDAHGVIRAKLMIALDAATIDKYLAELTRA